jgi:hypothetical protein
VKTLGLRSSHLLVWLSLVVPSAFMAHFKVAMVADYYV